MGRSDTVLQRKERKYVSSSLITLLLVTISGFVTWFFDAHGVWQQWTYLFHTLVGFWLVLVFIVFIFNHVGLAQGFKRPGQASIGWSSLLALSTVSLSGVVIGVIGQYESQRWIYHIHLVSGLLVVLLVLAHLFIFRWLSDLFGDGKARRSSFADALNRGLAGHCVLYTIGFITLIAGLSLIYSSRSSSFVDEAAVTFEKAYGEGKFSPSLAQTSTAGFLDARRIGRSDKCGSCHPQITHEWRSSMHGRSATDQFFQKNLHSLAHKKGIAAARYCAGCHIPIALLSGELSEGGRLDKGMHIDEGVSCMACHGISKAISLEGVGSYLYEPEQDYLFADSDGFFGTEINNYLININPRQHRIDMARDILASPTNCATCHEQYIDSDLNDWGWVKLQSQYQAWVEGPFSTHSDKAYASDKSYRCQDCHFPLVESDDPSADRLGRHRSHRSPAANTAVPFLLGDKEQLETVIDFLKDDRLSLTIHLDQKEHDGGMVKSDETVFVQVGVSSNRIGHLFPAGTIDINQPWLELMVVDVNGKIVFSSGKIDDQNVVDKNARFYYSSLVDRHGNRVWKHDLFNAVGESYGNLIDPGKADIQAYRFKIPKWAQSPLRVKARLRYRKFNHDYSSWALGDNNLKLPIVDMADDEMEISFTE
ncbi:MAG: hypothetical protein GY770_14380 [Aestuariibacter sp.]|nr:hypothetical protein [Aestuariibacter sp.]